MLGDVQDRQAETLLGAGLVLNEGLGAHGARHVDDAADAAVGQGPLVSGGGHHRHQHLVPVIHRLQGQRVRCWRRRIWQPIKCQGVRRQCWSQ